MDEGSDKQCKNVRWRIVADVEGEEFWVLRSAAARAGTASIAPIVSDKGGRGQLAVDLLAQLSVRQEYAPSFAEVRVRRMYYIRRHDCRA